MPATPSHDLYEAVCGYDANNNGTLEHSEVLTVFEKTPRKDSLGTDATQNLELLDKFIIVDQGQFTVSKNTVIGYDLPGTDYAGDLVAAFARGSKTIADAIRTDQIAITSTQPGLSHPLGEKWSALNAAVTYRFTFPDGSPAANDIHSHPTGLKAA